MTSMMFASLLPYACCFGREQEERDERHKLKKTLQQEAVRIGSTPMALQKIMAGKDF